MFPVIIFNDRIADSYPVKAPANGFRNDNLSGIRAQTQEQDSGWRLGDAPPFGWSATHKAHGSVSSQPSEF
jgi:hypothetical protein